MNSPTFDLNTSSIDLHLHLYGALGVEDIFELCKNFTSFEEGRIKWYESEFRNALGIDTPLISLLKSKKPKALDELRRSYLFTAPSNFQVFQAKFNLLISLFPLSHDSAPVLDQALRTQEPHSVREYRVLFPYAYNHIDLEKFLNLYAERLHKHNQKGESFALIAWSLPRDPQSFIESFKALHLWRENNIELSYVFSAVDLCGDEEFDPPQNKLYPFEVATSLSRKAKQRPLKILHHVGEVWRRVSFFTSLRRIVEVAQMGFCNRIGHASALGAGLSHMHNQSIPVDPPEESHRNSLFFPEWHNFQKATHYTDEVLSYARKMQDFSSMLLNASQKELPWIESCPTSNFLISACKEEEVPLIGFSRKSSVPFLNKFLIGSDDPGIMNTSYSKEFERSKKLGVSEKFLDLCQLNAKKVFESYFE